MTCGTRLVCRAVLHIVGVLHTLKEWARGFFHLFTDGITVSQVFPPLVIGPEISLTHWVEALGQHSADSISSINTRERRCCSGLSLLGTGTQKGRDRGALKDSRGFRKMKRPFGGWS